MLVPLVILAVLSLVGGWVGIPGSLGGGNHFEKFLGPVFRSSTPAVNPEHAQPGETAPPEQTTEGSEPKTGHSTEIIFTGISVWRGIARPVSGLAALHSRPRTARSNRWDRCMVSTPRSRTSIRSTNSTHGCL